MCEEKDMTATKRAKITIVSGQLRFSTFCESHIFLLTQFIYMLIGMFSFPRAPSIRLRY